MEIEIKRKCYIVYITDMDANICLDYKVCNGSTSKEHAIFMAAKEFYHQRSASNNPLRPLGDKIKFTIADASGNNHESKSSEKLKLRCLPGEIKFNDKEEIIEVQTPPHETTDLTNIIVEGHEFSHTEGEGINKSYIYKPIEK